MKVIVTIQDPDQGISRGLAEDEGASHISDALRLFIGATLAAGFHADSVKDAILEYADMYLERENPV